MDVNFDNIIKIVTDALLQYSYSFQRSFVIRNIYGRIRIFIENPKIDVGIIKSSLIERIIHDGWIERVEAISKDSLMYKELQKISQVSEESDKIFRCTQISYT